MNSMSGVQTFIVGCSQHSHRDIRRVDHPGKMMAEAAKNALADAGIDNCDLVDGLGCVEPFSWAYEDLGGFVAEDMGLRKSVEQLWVPAGGTSPLDLLHLIGQKINSGDLDCAVICGAESMRARRRAAKEDRCLDWPDRSNAVDTMRGQRRFSSDLERRHGLIRPIHLFPLIENALRSAYGRSASEQIEVASKILEKNAKVAADNPHAWFQDAPTADDIATVTQDNRMIVYPYTKRMNAIMDVDQSAAIVVVSKAFLEKHGLKSRAAAVLGGTGAEEVWSPIERRNLAKCPAMEFSVGTALQRAGLEAHEVNSMDLYSCFPSAVQLGLQALDTIVDDPRPFSLTGGLAYAGGPGNAYVLHSLSAALEKLRSAPDGRVMVTGIGMANTKHAATVLAGTDAIPPNANGLLSYREQLDLEPVEIVDEAVGRARINTYAIEYGRDGAPSNIVLFVDLEGGARTIANMRDLQTGERELLADDPIGRSGTVTHDPSCGRNMFEFAA